MPQPSISMPMTCSSAGPIWPPSSALPTQQQLAATVAAATRAGHAVVARGGGMSYTGGYTQGSPGAVLVDTASMDRILDIDEIDTEGDGRGGVQLGQAV